MRRKDIIGGTFYLAVGLVFTLYSLRVDIGEWSEPGPGFLPFYGGLTMIAMAVLLLAKSILSKGVGTVGDPFFAERDSWKRVLCTLLALVAYNLLLGPLGFMAVTFCFVAFLVKFIFPESWLRSLVTAALSTACAQVVFVNLLEINFPKGIVGF